MADSPAANTRKASKLKLQGHRKDSGCHYRPRSRSTAVVDENDKLNRSKLEKINTHSMTRVRSPSPSLLQARDRHISRDSIEQGRVGNLRNRLEQKLKLKSKFVNHVCNLNLSPGGKNVFIVENNGHNCISTSK